MITEETSGTRGVGRTGSLGGVILAVLTIVVIAAYGSQNDSTPSTTTTNQVQVSWGVTRYAHGVVNIRERRSSNSPIVGKLQPGEAVKSDFLSDGWYAVFNENASERSEEAARGYVYALLLHSAPVLNQPESPRDAASRVRPNYRLTSRDIKGVPIPIEAQLVTEDRAPASMGINQEVYSVPWTSDRIISFFDANMPRERFIKQNCVDYQGVPTCLYQRGRQIVGVEYEHGRFTLTEITKL